MADIPNNKYTTINEGRISVGGKSATTYRGEQIKSLNYVREYFADIQELNKNVVELHVISSETRGKYAKPGNPSEKTGPSVWCRIKLKNGNLTAWVFIGTYGSATNCAGICAYDCVITVRYDASFRQAVLSATIDNGQNDATNTKVSRSLGCVGVLSRIFAGIQR